ncbi:MAG TPA: hypothetical protein DCS60_04815, partial [Opitutae bacterium]|nr:hypothetical protein [Opitutae bacterium]
MKIKLVSTVAVIALSAISNANHHGGKKALEIDFPPPFLIGTPVQVNLPHLEAPGTPRPTIMIPEGVVNLAAGKEV